MDVPFLSPEGVGKGRAGGRWGGAGGRFVMPSYTCGVMYCGNRRVEGAPKSAFGGIKERGKGG